MTFLSLPAYRLGRAPALVSCAVVAAALAMAPRARACGGCFVARAGTESTVVTDHRMAFAMSPQQTVLWDQIEYSGNPASFAWVLPVRAGAVVQLSHDEWFAALDAMTSPVITGPVTNCGGGGGGGVGCGSSKASGAAISDTSSNSGVQVISQAVVGPYETVTLRSTEPHALEAWLDANGYTIAAAFRPTINAYVSEGFDFIALRLQPGKGVQSMQPVRVVTAGADPTLPLRMVAAGAGTTVGITLFVISEGRYEARSPFANALIDDSKLVWLHTQSRSNYQDLSKSLMQGNRGRTWLTEFAGSALLSTGPTTPTHCGQRSPGGAATYYGGESLGDVYYGQCACNVPNECPGQFVRAPTAAAGGDAGEAADADASGDAGPGESVDATDAGLGPSIDAGADAGDAARDPDVDANAMVTTDAGTCSSDPCATFDDLDTALVGMHPNDTWVTRLRSILPIDALSEGDLHIEGEATQRPVSNLHVARVYDDPSYNPCGGGSNSECSAGVKPTNLLQRGLVPGAFTFLGLALARRRARRSRRSV